MTIKAYRSGKTARHWTCDCRDEKLTHGTDKILFDLSMPSKGGGVTDVQLQVTSESFERLAELMAQGNADAASRAFVSAGSWNVIVQAMLEFNKAGAIWTIGDVLKSNEDEIVGACGTLLLDYQQKRDRLRVVELREREHLSPALDAE